MCNKNFSALTNRWHGQVGILARRLTPDRVSIQIQERHLHARVISPEGELEFELDVELYDEVIAPLSYKNMLRLVLILLSPLLPYSIVWLVASSQCQSGMTKTTQGCILGGA